MCLETNLEFAPKSSLFSRDWNDFGQIWKENTTETFKYQSGFALWTYQKGFAKTKLSLNWWNMSVFSIMKDKINSTSPKAISHKQKNIRFRALHSFLLATQYVSNLSNISNIYVTLKLSWDISSKSCFEEALRYEKNSVHKSLCPIKPLRENKASQFYILLKVMHIVCLQAIICKRSDIFLQINPILPCILRSISLFQKDALCCK